MAAAVAAAVAAEVAAVVAAEVAVDPTEQDRPIIQLRDVTKTYEMGDSKIYALRKVQLDIRSGEFIAIMGPSGSGKSTLMQILGLLDVPDEGSYKLNNSEVSNLSEQQLAIERARTLGFVFQQFNLLPRLTAAENVSLPLLYTESAKDPIKAHKLLSQVGLISRVEHKTNQLSGGQQQRVAIARALINNPKVILADEPTGNLDSTSSKEIIEILRSLNQEGMTIILVTHEEDIAREARRLIRMKDGEIVANEVLIPEPSVSKVVSPIPIPLLQQSHEENPGPHQTEIFWINRWSKWLYNDFMTYFHEGLKTLLVNKVRTGLSMLGILIGVAAVVAMLALGNGAQQAIEQQLASLGTNLLVLRAGTMRVGGVASEEWGGPSMKITLSDVLGIQEQIAHVKNTGPTVNGRAQVTYENKNWNTSVMGTSSAYPQIRAAEPDMGRFFTEEENRKRSRVAVIGRTVVKELFGSKQTEINPIGAMIKINKVIFQIIGVLPEKGASGWRDQDDVIVIPLFTAMYRLLGKDTIDYLDIEVTEPTYISSVQNSLQEFMVKRHKIPISQAEGAFQIRNMADIQSTLAQSSETMSILLASIAAISLLVGGIGIMNIMLVSVTERTREIGLRKAVGAQPSDILSQFLSEAMVISTFGGLMGIFLGSLSAVILSVLIGWNTSISFSSIFISFFFSAFIGIVFGIYPARKASQLHPIQALRFE